MRLTAKAKVYQIDLGKDVIIFANNFNSLLVSLLCFYLTCLLIKGNLIYSTVEVAVQKLPVAICVKSAKRELPNRGL